MTFIIFIFGVLSCEKTLEDKLFQAKTLALTGEVEEAEKIFESLINELNQSASRNREQNLTMVYDDLISFHTGITKNDIKLAKSLESFIVLTSNTQKKKHAYLQLEKIYRLKLKNKDKAQEVLKQWIDKYARFNLGDCPKESSVVLDYSMFLMRTHQYQEQIRLLQNARKCYRNKDWSYFHNLPAVGGSPHPFVEASHIIAKQVQASNPELAIKILNETLKYKYTRKEDVSFLLYALGDTFKVKGDIEKAEYIFKEWKEKYNTDGDDSFVPKLKDYPRFNNHLYLPRH